MREPGPVPTPEQVLWRIHTAALVSVLGKRAEPYLRRMADLIATEDSLAEVAPIRSTPNQAAEREARREAVIAFRHALPALVAALPKASKR